MFLLVLVLSGCMSVGTDEYNAPGANITTDSGLDIADLRVGSFRPEPYPAGSDVLVLARLVAKGEPDRLTAASSSAAQKAVLIGADGSPSPGLVIPKDGVLALTPTGPHVLLQGLRRPLAEGDHIPVTLSFQRAGEIRTIIARRVDSDGIYTRSP